MDFETETDSLMAAIEIPDSNPNDGLLQQNPGNRGRGIVDEIRDKIRKKIRICLAQCLVSLAKIISTITLLSIGPSKCDLPLEKWLYLMIAHDTLHLITTMVECHHRSSRLSSPASELFLNESSDSSFFNPDYIFSERNNQPCSQLLVFKELNKMFYVFLFMWGNMLLFFTESDCGIVSPNQTLLVLIFTLMGYVYLFYPILMLLSITVCLPFLLIFGVFYHSNENQPANTEILRKLEERPYGRANDTEDDCAICKQEYSSEDKITSLSCDPKHYFHSECIKKWLTINGVCPICRHRLQ